MKFPSELDHLVYGVLDLEAAVDNFESQFGVRPAMGGSHPGLGTRNALVSLGPTCYLELMGPDPAQSAPAARPFGLDSIAGPRFIAWAIHVENLDERVEAAKRQGYDPGPILPMNRKTPDGQELAWRLTFKPGGAAIGIVPFMIDWGGCETPATTAPVGCTLISLVAEHPRPDEIRRSFEALGIELEVREGPKLHEPALVARFATPNGEVELR